MEITNVGMFSVNRRTKGTSKYYEGLVKQDTSEGTLNIQINDTQLVDGWSLLETQVTRKYLSFYSGGS